tara:strand:+ start:1078 stop:10002 length:8925 start_codon:yes stop_codon:yes gene_type:complete
MPLPKEYYDILKTGDKPFTTPTQPTQPSPTGLYFGPEDVAEEATSAWGGVGDFLWSAGEGFTSGMSWGATDLAGVTGQEPWEEMSGGEKAGWILGEGASFFAPWGPFGLLGKGGKALAKTGNKFIGKAAQEASETGIANLTGETGKAVAKAMEKGTQFSDDVVSGLNKVAKDDLGVRWIKDLGATGKAALDASDNLTMAGTRAVMKSFKDAGIDIAERDAGKIAGEFVESVKGGTYVNDVAEWVTRGLAGRIPDTATGFMSKYLGMAAQDMMFMGIHGLGSGKIKALANGEDFDATGALSHAALMSLGFPLIRKIPNLAGMGHGGMVTASQGIKSYMNQFKKTNYKAIQEMHGDDVVKNMLKVMVKGEKKNLWSRSKLGDAHWKAGGKVYKSAEEIEKALPKMKIDDTITLLNKMNKTVNQQMMKDWGPKFITDTIGAVPRMGLGVLAMNPWVVDKDAWGSMEGPELASHLFMAAVMTRGRGAWGHAQQRAYFADFTPYHEALNVLGVNTKNVKDVLRFHDGSHPYEGMGAALGTHEVGVEMVDIFDTALKNAESRPSSRDFSNPDHSLVVDMANLYNVIKKSADPTFKPIKPQNLDAKTLNTLAHRLSGIKFADGNSIGEIGYEGSLVRLTLEPAKRGLEVYKQMLAELADLGYGVSVTEDGRVTGTHIMSNKEGKSIDDANTFNRVLDALAGINEATVRSGIDVTSEASNYEKIVKRSGLTEPEFNLKTREIIDRNMDVLGREYGDKNIYRDPVESNPMWEFFKQAKGIEAAERVYNIATGKFPAGDPVGDKILTENMDSLFKLSDGKYASSIDQYKGLFKDLIKDPKTDKEKEANEVIVEHINDMRQLFNIRKQVLGVSSKDVSEKGSISAEGLSIVQGKWKDIFGSLPREWKQTWDTHTKQLYIERVFKGRGFDRRAVNLISFMSENNLVLPDAEGKINMPSKKAMMDELASRKMSKKELDQYERALDTIKKVLGEDVVTEIDWAFTETGKRQLESVDVRDYLKAAKMLGNEMYADLLVNTQAVLGEIAAISSGTRQRVHEIYNKTTDIIDTLDPASGKRPVADPIKEINNLKEELISLERVARSKDSKDELGQAIVQLHKLIDAIDPATGKFNISIKKTLTETEQLSGDEFGIHDALTRPLQTTIEKIFNREHEAVNKLQELVVKLENLSSLGKAGLGLDKSDTMRIVEDLSRQWFEVYKGETGKGVKVLSELISEVNKKGFFGDALTLLESVDARINREVILKNEHNPLNEDGVRMSEALENAYKTHEHHRSVTEILKDYGLVDRDGKIDESFRNAVTANPYRALLDNVKPKIYAQTDKSIAQKDREWRKFKENDAIELLTNIYNSKPINRVKILGITEAGKQRGVVEFNNNAPHIQHPNTQYFSDKGFKVHWIDDTMSVDIGDGKLRNAGIDSFNNPDLIQKFLNEALRTDKITREMLDGFKAIDHGISEKDVRKILKNPTDYVFYLRLSPMDKMMFVATDKNLKLMDTEFETWYNDTAGRLKGKNKSTFESMFKDLLDKPNTSRAIVELKMLLPYLDHAGKRGEVEKMVAEYAGDARAQTLAKIQTNMYKRGFLSDGGTTQPMRTEVLRWVQGNHPNKDVRDEAKRIIRNGGFVTGVIGDAAAEGEGGRAHPLNIESLELGQLQVIGNQASGLIKELAQAQQRSLGDMPSLLNSLLDGGKFASEKVMKLVMAQKGMLDTDFSNSPNGAKTIIFATGNNQMLGKGYLIYHPDIAAQMPKDVDIMLGESSAKAYWGTAIDGNPLSPHDISQAGPKWQSSIKNMANGNKMLMPIESLGISFTSKSESGVAISPSIFDFQSPAAIDKAITWMGFESKLKQIGVQWNTVHRDGAKLAEWLYEIGESSGNPLDKGDTGLSKLLFEYGAMPNNPLVQKALRRLLRSSNYKHLGKVPNQGGGEDNFIVPNIDGKLSVPLYADLHGAPAFPGDPVTGKRIDRVSVNYGGIGLNKRTGGRQLGNGVNSNLEGERFIFRDGNGVDVVVGIENGKFKYYSTFYDKTGEGINYRGTDKSGADVFNDANIKMDSNAKQRAQGQMKELSRLVKKYNLNYRDVFKLLNGEVVSSTDSKGLITSFDMKVDKALKMQFGLMSHAVPVVGHDKVIFRVEKIMDNMDGLTEVNVHDLRTVMQRDNDGDHLFTHTKLPWDVFVGFAKENGRKDDFRMFEREQVLDQNYINIFGIGNNGKAGEKPEQVGFHNYAAKLHKAKMMTGQVIGARNAISWLNRLGFQMGKEPLLKDFLANKGMDSSEWQTLDKFYDTIQNALDIHSGVHQAISSQQKLKDFLFFGHAEKYAEPTGDPVFDKHNQPGLGFFKDVNFGKTRIQKEMFYEILKTLKKANMIQNETWDEKGSRAPEPFEIKNAYYDMKGFFSNPTGYLAKKLARKIGRIRDRDQRDLLMSEYADMFYGDTIDIRKRQGKGSRESLYFDILKGKHDSIMKKIFSFDNIPSDNPETAFDMSIGGHVMKNLLKTNGFWDANYEGLAERRGDGAELFDKAGFFVKNIESFVETARMFGDKPLEFMKGNNITVDTFDTRPVSPEIRNALNNGILKELIHRQHRNVMGTLEYFRAEKFANPDKVAKLQNRLANLQSAMDIMDQQIAKDMVIDRSDTQIMNIKKSGEKNFKYLEKGRKVSVYRIRGDVKVIEEPAEGAKPSLFTHGVDGKRLDYGQLEFVGTFDNKGKMRVQEGYTYVVDRKPKKMISQSGNEARYSQALFKATYGNEISPEIFIKDNVNDFRDDVRQLRASISMDYIKTVQNALSSRVLSDGLFAMQQAKEGRVIAEFMDRWEPSVSGGEPIKLLLRYLLQPQLTPSSYYKDAQGHEMPAYKTNEHLYKTVMQWAENNGQKGFVRELVKDVEHFASGRDTEIDISSYERGRMDRFDYSQLGDMANPVRSLAKHLNLFFASPILNDKLKQVIPRGKGKIQTVIGRDGQKIPIRRVPKKDEYWNVQTDQTGEGC